jgi:transposase
MGRRKQTVKPLPTIWEVNDELWAIFQTILAKLDPPPLAPGRPRGDPRAALNGIIFILRSGLQWNKLPKEFGDDSTVHRTMQRWIRNGVLKRFWAVEVENCEELGGVDWEWQSADTAMGKARFGGDQIGPNPTDRGKPGTKRSLIVEADGGPLGVVVAGANVNDQKLLEQTIEAVVVKRPRVTKKNAAPVPRQGVRQPHRTRGGRVGRAHAAYPEDRGGEAGRSETETEESASLGRGAHAGVAEQVSCDSGSVCEEVIELSRDDSGGLCDALVSSAVSTSAFEIVSKPQAARN